MTWGKAAGAGAALLIAAFIGHGYYEDHYSTTAHLRRDCSAVWEAARSDDATMTHIFETALPANDDDMHHWLTLALNLRQQLRLSGCFTAAAITAAADTGEYLPSPIEPAALDSAITCVHDTDAGDCNQPDAHLAVPIRPGPATGVDLAGAGAGAPTIDPLPAPAPVPTYTIPTSVPVNLPDRTSPDVLSNGPTAVCRDGTYSYSRHHRGTCSHHGGVLSWYR